MPDVVNIGDKIHVMTRRSFDGDLRRHMVGEILAFDDGIVRVRGYTFLYDQFRNEFVRRPEIRTRLLGLGDSGHVINVLPAEVEIERLRYTHSDERRLVLTDGRGYSLDINEFSTTR